MTGTACPVCNRIFYCSTHCLTHKNSDQKIIYVEEDFKGRYRLPETQGFCICPTCYLSFMRKIAQRDGDTKFADAFLSQFEKCFDKEAIAVEEL